MNENINDGTHFQGSETHKDHGLWVPGMPKEVNDYESLHNMFVIFFRPEWDYLFGLVMAYWDIDLPTLAQIMASCLTAPIHYLYPCWILINEIQWHTAERKFAVNALVTVIWNMKDLENDAVKITATSPRGQWVNPLRQNDAYMHQQSSHHWFS